MKFKVLDIKKKHIDKLNKDVIEAEVKGEDNVITKKVQIWPDFPMFDTITFDAQVEGDLVVKTKGEYTNITLYAPKPQGNFKAGSTGIKAAQERKAEMIEKAQDRKSESIAYFNSVNCAIALAGNFFKGQPMPDEDVKEFITEWRDWFLSEYRKYEASPETDKKNAF